MSWDQYLVLLSAVAVYLSQSGRHRIAAILGLIAQPAWFYAAWTAEQWGVLAVCVVFTLAWARGLWGAKAG